MDAGSGGIGKIYRGWARRSPPCPQRPRFLDAVVLLICAVVLFQAFGMEPFQVPTGSMAPTLLGHHRACTCLECGATIVVGRARSDVDGRGGERFYGKSYCANCGAPARDIAATPETAGDQVLVNKAAFAMRQARRWEVVVFRLFGLVFIKRVIALPGEEVLIHDGDVFVDGKLARKTLDQARATRIAVFDQRHQPADGWGRRWERQPDNGTPQGPQLLLDGRPGRQMLTFHGEMCGDDKSSPLTDEYAYNSGLVRGSVPVHNFLMEADVEVLAGQGTLAIRLCDGQDWVEAQCAVGRSALVELRSWPARDQRLAAHVVGRGQALQLHQGRTYRVEMAFVDRRVNVRVDGRLVIEDFDLPEPGSRDAVASPVQLETNGATVALRDFRLFRDVHYAARGSQAVNGKAVRLGREQYFVLGDNSANSQDSRFWPADALSASQLIGPAFLVHLPSRPLRWQTAGWQGQVPDFSRMRWLR